MALHLYARPISIHHQPPAS